MVAMLCLGGILSKGEQRAEQETYTTLSKHFIKEASRTSAKCISEAIPNAGTYRTVGTLQEAKACQERGGSRNPEECNCLHSHGLDHCMSFLSQNDLNQDRQVSRARKA